MSLRPLLPQIPWAVQCKGYSSTVRTPAGGMGVGSGGGDPSAGSAVTLVSFSDLPTLQFAQAGRDGEVLRCGAQMESVMELLGGRYRIMRTVRIAGFKLSLGDVELRVGQVPATTRRAEGTGVTVAEIRYLPCAYESTCESVLQAFADAALPSGWTAVPDLFDISPLEPVVGAAHDDEPEFDDRQLVRQYLAILRDKKAL